VTISYADAGDLLEAWAQARAAHDGDAFTALFDAAATLAVDPWSAPLAGHNDLRAYLLAAALAERDLQLVVERHWVSGDTVLAALHAAWNGSDGVAVRQAGFLTADVGVGDSIMRMRLWSLRRDGSG
jgi:hypothetical protein